MNRLIVGVVCGVMLVLPCLAATNSGSLLPKINDASVLEKLPQRLQHLPHNTPDAIVDLGVGLWAWPVPYDLNGDGHPALLVASGGLPGNGTYYFENTGRKDPDTGQDVFKAPLKLGKGGNDITPSYLPDGSLRVLGPGVEYPDFTRTGTDSPVPLTIKPSSFYKPTGNLRGNQWSYVDYRGTGDLSLVVGFYDYSDYGWDGAYDRNGRWTNGPLHGYVYRFDPTDAGGATGTPETIYAAPERMTADGRDIDVYGLPSPVFADFRGNGKLDLICGEFVDGFTYFENIGTREEPRYTTGRRLRYQNEPLTMHLCMIVVVAYDWNRDGRMDLVVGQEDGRVAWLENTGEIVGGAPEFKPPQFFRQLAHNVKFGTISVPVAYDWDGDGLTDLLVGNTAGEVGFIKNLGGEPMKWAPPVLLEAEGEPIRIMAGYNLSIQGPCESKFGYSNPGVGDWDGDGLPDLLVNTIIGKIVWFKNIGTRTQPRLAAGQSVEVAWEGTAPKPSWNWWDPEPGELVVQWRCSPYVIDLDEDGTVDLVAPDHEGYLAFYRQVERNGKRVLLPGERIFRTTDISAYDGSNRPQNATGGLLRMNSRSIGASGRRTFVFTDWDGDGKLDLLVNSLNADFLRNVSTKPGEWLFENQGPIDGFRVAGHNSAPTVGDWDGDGIPELLLGVEDGFFYYMKNPRAD